MDHIIHSSSFPSSSLSNPNLARLAIPYSTSLPSLRNQANDHHMSGAQPTSPTRGPTPVDLQSHLYQSFLSRKTADVALRIRGSWNALYKLHRVILIQAGFFQSLFTAGFSESKAKVSVRRSEPDVIDIVFDDPNITRAGECFSSQFTHSTPPGLCGRLSVWECHSGLSSILLLV